MFDDGVLTVLRARTTSDAGRMPASSYAVLAKSCYKERTVGATRFYNAQQANMQVDKLLRIPRIYGIMTGDMVSLQPYACEAPGTLFQVRQVQQVVDEDTNLPATDLSLQQMTASAKAVTT